MNRVLVIGATGRVGRQGIAQLSDAGVQVRALVRDPQTAGLPAHVETVFGDLTLPESLDGIDAVFLVWTAPAATVAPALERMLKQTRRVPFVAVQNRAPLFFRAGQPNPVSVVQAEIEGRIEASGCRWTFLRPGMIAANAMWWWAAQVRSGDMVRWPYLAAETAPIDERDIAAVAVRALCEEGHGGAEYVLTGPESLTQWEQISTIGQAIGRPAFVTSTVAEITGVAPGTFRDWAPDHAAQFRGRTPIPTDDQKRSSVPL